MVSWRGGKVRASPYIHHSCSTSYTKSMRIVSIQKPGARLVNNFVMAMITESFSWELYVYSTRTNKKNIKDEFGQTLT